MEPCPASSVSSPPDVLNLAEERMLREDVVRELLARLERGEKTKTIARTLGIGLMKKGSGVFSGKRPPTPFHDPFLAIF